MEKTYEFRRIRIILLVLFATVIPKNVFAQIAVYDEQKFKQWNSMENGDWDFAPNGYYYLFHKDYSGAHMRWQWRGFKSGYIVYFDEADSNRKRVFIERAAHVPLVMEDLSKTKEELDNITPLSVEETARTLERNIDIVYSQYKDSFNELQAVISKNLLYCLDKSQGKLIEAIDILQRENDLVISDINYIHEEGPGKEIETTKRQISYEELKDKLEDIAKKSINLVLYAKAYY